MSATKGSQPGTIGDQIAMLLGPEAYKQLQEAGWTGSAGHNGTTSNPNTIKSMGNVNDTTNSATPLQPTPQSFSSHYSSSAVSNSNQNPTESTSAPIEYSFSQMSLGHSQQQPQYEQPNFEIYDTSSEFNYGHADSHIQPSDNQPSSDTSAHTHQYGILQSAQPNLDTASILQDNSNQEFIPNGHLPIQHTYPEASPANDLYPHPEESYTRPTSTDQLHFPSSLNNSLNSSPRTSTSSFDSSRVSTIEITRLYNNSRKPSHMRHQSLTSTTLFTDENALKLYREQAKKTDDPTVQISFAKFLIEQVNSVGRDPAQKESEEKLMEEAVYWIDRLASKGHGEACYIKGTWYEMGLFRHTQSMDKAKSLYNSSVKQGFPAANYKLAQFYENNKYFPKAITYYNRASALGDAKASFKLAMVYLNGQLKQPINYKQGMGYLKMAARGASREFPIPAFVLGQILADEYETPIPHEFTLPDGDAACSLFSRASDLGYPPAIARVAQVYERGEFGRSVNEGKALQFYKDAAELGEPNAMLWLSRYYLTDEASGVARDENLAFEWARRAAEGGLPSGELAVGHMYEFGIGCQMDLSSAQKYYQLAAEHGVEAAKQRVKSRNIGTISRKQGEEALERLRKRRGQGKNSSDCLIS
ncbi:uncharacterized protein VTP21DRAFT_1760 [Calcarisporiella thermophila]|uniref:uncharacterized protein n=1 Tax=Calcarisporiella thermophila TaxID=911321 RepID=UPI003744412D